MKFQDLTGQKFNMLTVIERAPNVGHNTAWYCRCDCGKITKVSTTSLKKGFVKSCGCASNHNVDLTGKRFGRLTVVKKLPSQNNRSVWLCKCDCGNETEAKLRDLMRGDTKSCGCFKSDKVKERNDKSSSKIIGKKIGKLTVIEKAGVKEYKNGHRTSLWKCLCECGNIKIVEYEQILNENVKSCGCLGPYSYGEELTCKILQEFDVDFSTQYTNPTLLSDIGYHLFVDFAIYTKNKKLAGLIEYQGVQHYEDKDFGRRQREVTDDIKRKWCKDNKIPLLEIRYDDKNIKATVKQFLEQLHLC